MELSNYQRVQKLLFSLIRKPHHLPGYIRYSLLGRQLPIDYELPWWAFDAIQHADRVLAGRNIFEYGTGGSTIRFAKIAKRICCVEDDAEWGKLVLDRVQAQCLSNVMLNICPFDFRKPVGFEESDYLNELTVHQDATFDVIIIDGQDWTFQERLTCFRFVEPQIPEGGLIIVDDFWRYETLLKENRAKEVRVFESVGPCRIGVTSTAFFQY